MVSLFIFYLHFSDRFFNFSMAGWVLLLVGSTYKCYLFANNLLTIGEANTACTNFNTHLAQFETLAEYNAIVTQSSVETSQWYTIGYAGSCDIYGNVVSWSYFTGGGADMSFFTWYPGTPRTGLWWNYLLFHSRLANIYNIPNQAGYTYYYLCEFY